MDQRLTLVKEMARPCRCGADIGTDHGYLICSLVEEGIAQRGIAADINAMPLDKARQEVIRRGLEERIQLVLTDGLTGIDPEEVDEVFIAGMGGDLMAQILDRWPGSRRSDKVFCLQPMSKGEHLRRFLFQEGFYVEEEKCCVAAGRPYSVMRVIYTGRREAHLPEEEYVGKIDFSTDEAETYGKKVLAALEKRRKGLAQGTGDRMGELQETEALIQAVKRRMEQ